MSSLPNQANASQPCAPLTASERRLISRMGRAWESGASIRQLAQMFHHNRGTVARLLKKGGYKLQKRLNPYDTLTPQMREEAWAQYEAKISIKRIAAFLGCSEHVARQVIRECGELRPHAERMKVDALFSWRESAMCYAVLYNGLSLEYAVQLWLPKTKIEYAREVLRRYRDSGR